jgi:hypothetical protein
VVVALVKPVVVLVLAVVKVVVLVKLAVVFNGTCGRG